MADDAAWLAEGWPHVWLPYAQMQTVIPPLPVISAQGCRLKLADGRELIDGIASWWSVCHGYQHPHIVGAIRKQAEQLSHVMFAGLAHEPAYTLAKRLCGFTRMDMERVFFAESGSVAVEVALKMALQYWRNKGAAKKNKFLSFNHGYHGDTAGAMGVSAKSHFNNAYESLTLRNFQLDIPTDEYSFAEFADTVAAIRGQLAAIIVEPLVQAAGGFRFHSPDILSEIRRVAREQEVLFIADEIATGFGRTGNRFACDEAGISPDILCLGKALTGGHIPLAATLASKAVFDAFLGDSADKALMHGPTFMANPLACAAANASLDLFEREPRLAQAEALEQKLRDGLSAFTARPQVVDMRVKGAIGVLELKEGTDVYALRRAFVEHGAWIRPFDTSLYLMPPFTISDDEMATLFGAMDRALEK
ncbi:MAG: adenosylmethionine--8-amino-7-oxononanoate transaminase [Alphaproteobacteria bacterium]